MEESNPPTAKGAKPTKEEFDKLKKWYCDELARKDNMIEQLKKENMMLIRSSLKTSERLSEMQEIMKADKKDQSL